MSCFYLILIVGIGGCCSLPLPSSLTLVWSLQDQSSVLCLVPRLYDVAGAVWFLTTNQSQSGNFYPWRLNSAMVRISRSGQHLLQYGDPRPHILLPLNHHSSPSSENMKTHVSNPHVSNPHVSNPHISNPHVSNPHPANPHVSNPHPPNPHVSNPHPLNPHSSNPHVSNPHPSNPHPSNPHVSIPHVSNPHVSNPNTIFWPSPPHTLHRSWEFSIPSSVAFIPPLVGHLGPLDPPPFLDETVRPLSVRSVQVLGAPIGHVVSPETLHVSTSSSPSTNMFPDFVTCFVAQTGGDDMLGHYEDVSGDGPVCNEEDLPAELG
ncbi:histidine-rich glycoprotein-like isoform X2 [Hyla sarda]|nr:histidine-rich glycoprotein-like isoform X2 [Hyla sarda]